jgi:predicted ATPase
MRPVWFCWLSRIVRWSLVGARGTARGRQGSGDLGANGLFVKEYVDGSAGSGLAALRAPTYNTHMDRIRRIQINGLRNLENVSLDLNGLTVLIGENGSGKSTIIEACRLLKQMAFPNRFVEDTLFREHGLGSAINKAEDSFLIVVDIDDPDPNSSVLPLRYILTVYSVSSQPVIREDLFRLEGGLAHDADVRMRQLDEAFAAWLASTPTEQLSCYLQSDFSRAAGQLTIPGRDVPAALRDSQKLALHAFGSFDAPSSARRVLDAFERIQIHQPFETRPVWYDRLTRNGDAKGGRYLFRPSDGDPDGGQLNLGGRNVGALIHQLKGRDSAHWQDVLETLRLGLGQDLKEISVESRGGDYFEASARFERLPDPVPFSQLSEGQLAYITFVMLTESAKTASLVAFDEPETHLNPNLLGRIVDLFGRTAETCPVLLATHSDRLLDMLEDPAGSIVLTELDEKRRTVLRRPDNELLKDWLTDYNGYGSVRADGYEVHLYADEPKPTE